ncbi:hypothetical protein DF185_09310 [Marinifilum breve]|uniref:Alpha-galactosidase NEW3 domain-containing protein n=1 Tax=Marinifilum breve TaxID=2184082 RepID=A0A2V3ZYA7_9BACT|nr:hypothetical protein [Marinifilum breve]PXY01655.1 hypothetical protein DF185_09310 [Marinifilum breve]
MIRKFGYIQFVQIFVLLFTITTAANAQVISINNLTDSLFCMPNDAISLRLIIENNSDNEIDLQSEIKLPEGWKLNLGANNLKLAANRKRLVLFNVFIPEGCEKGSYAIAVVFKNSELNIHNEANLNIQVQESIKLNVEYNQQNDYCLAGDTVVGEFFVHNRSNCAMNLVLKPNNCIYTGDTNVSIGMDSIMQVKVLVATYKDIIEFKERGFSLLISRKNTEEHNWYAYGKIKVLPTGNAKPDKFNRIPIDFKLNSMAYKKLGKWQNGSMVELSSSKPIVIKPGAYIDFKFVGPNRYGKPVLGGVDRYWARFVDSTKTFVLGDQTFTATELTEQSRGGRGAKVKLKKGAFQFSAFANKPRFIQGLESEFAFSSSTKLNETTEIGLTYLRKNEELRKSNLYSLTAKRSIGGFFNLDSEVSYGKNNIKDGSAFKMIGDVMLKNLSGGSKFIYASKGYPGYYSNSVFMAGNLSYNITETSSIGVNYRRDDANSLKDTLSAIIPKSKSLSIRYGFGIGEHFRIALEGASSAMTDRTNPVRFDYTQRTGGISMIAAYEKFSCGISGALGKYENKLTFVEDKLFNIEHNLSYKFAKMNVGYSLSYEESNKTIELDSKKLLIGLHLSAKIGEKSNLNFDFRNTYKKEEYYKNRSLLDFSFQTKVHKNGTLECYANYSLEKNSLGEKDLAVGLRYKQRINIPISKKKDLCNLSGCVNNFGADNVEGILVFLNGQVAITDKKGNFNFQNLKSGNYDLYIDKSAMSIDDMVIDELPIKMNVIPGDNKVALGVTKSSQLQLKFDYKKSFDMQNQSFQGKQYAFLLLSKGKIQISKRVALDKDFTVAKLLPGEWNVKLFVKKSSPIQILFKEKRINIKSGETHVEKITYRNKRRMIKFNQERISL